VENIGSNLTLVAVMRSFGPGLITGYKPLAGLRLTRHIDSQPEELGWQLVGWGLPTIDFRWAMPTLRP
jgi:hypothetical protein